MPIVPIIAHPLGFFDSWASRFVPNVICISLALQDLQAQPPCNMESNVAVNKPGAWIVGFEGYDDVTEFGHENNVATGWVDMFADDIWWIIVVPRL